MLQSNAAGLHLLVDDLPTAEALREALGQRLWLEIVRPGPGLASDASTPDPKPVWWSAAVGLGYEVAFD
jgi:hypothetical protein